VDYQRIRDALDIPLATGERSYTRRGFLPLLQPGLLDVIQPDLGNCGGITEGRKICDLAESYGATVQTHSCNTPLSVALSLHLEAAIPNFYIHEHHTSNTFRDIRASFVYDYQPVDGYFSLPELPGIGNEPTEQTLAESEIITVKG
jgi:L-alanine-DL-glutamate epimerase-like enolase superfamily enzyme